VARRLDRTLAAVQIYRHRRGIPNPDPQITPDHVWKPGEIKLLGQSTDVEVGRQIGCSAVVARHKRLKLGIRAWRPMPEYKLWTPAEDKLLGTLADKQLAEKLGRTKNAIMLRRLKFGIPPFNSR